MTADRVIRLDVDTAPIVAMLRRVADALAVPTDDRGAFVEPTPDDTAAPEPWEPQVGDRVTVHFTEHAGTILPGSAATVTASYAPHRRAVVTLDAGVAGPEANEGWHCDYDELRPLDAQPEQPATVGPEPLADTLMQAHSDWCDGEDDLRRWQVALAEAVHDLLAQYPADTPASQVYADWFGAR